MELKLTKQTSSSIWPNYNLLPEKSELIIKYVKYPAASLHYRKEISKDDQMDMGKWVNVVKYNKFKTELQNNNNKPENYGRHLVRDYYKHYIKLT